MAEIPIRLQPPIPGQGDGNKLGPQSNVPRVQKLVDQLKLADNITVTRSENEEGEEIIALSGEISESEYSALSDQLKKIESKNVKIDKSFLTTVEDQFERSLEEADQGQDQGDLEKPRLKFTADVSQTEVFSKTGLGNPWLKPNGLLALQKAMIELSIVQSQIKVDSAEFWNANIKNIVSLAEDLKGLITNSAAIQAAIHRVNSEAATAQMYAHITTAVVQGAILVAVCAPSLARVGKGGAKGIYKASKNLKMKTKTNQKTSETSTASGTTQQGTMRVEAQKANTTRVEKKDTANVERQNNQNTQAGKEKSGLEMTEKTMTQAHINQMVAQQLSSVVGSGSQAAISSIEAKKESDLAALTLQKAVFDSTQEVVRALSQLANKGVEQADRDRKDAAEILASALQTLVNVTEKLYKIGINPHTAA